jgi:hypothetical protein
MDFDFWIILGYFSSFGGSSSALAITFFLGYFSSFGGSSSALAITFF